MELGTVVEFIDRQKILCAAVTGIKNQRLRLLTEKNRELNLSVSRLSHTSSKNLDLSIGRDKTVTLLKEIAHCRNELLEQIDIRELWDVLKTEQEWIDLDTMTHFCFPDNPTHNHKSAVVRAFFRNRLYFKFNHDRFFPHSEKKVEQIVAAEKEKAHQEKMINDGGRWLKKLKASQKAVPIEEEAELIRILKSFYLFGKDSRYYKVGKAMITQAGMTHIDEVFPFLVRLGVFSEDENIELYRYEIPMAFPDEVIQNTNGLGLTTLESAPDGLPKGSNDPKRQDLTGLPLMTIDGQATLDYDDAISFEDLGDRYRLGVHIIDVGQFVKKDDPIDRQAKLRGSSIYMPDMKIPMLPPLLAEDLCSLKADCFRPAITIMIEINRSAEISHFEVFASRIKVKHQLSYYDVNSTLEENRDLRILRDIAINFRRKRIADGAVYINLPEINVWLNIDGEVTINKINRESPGRMLVSEIMIMANWLMATFLADNGTPAIFRTQMEPKNRLFPDSDGTLYQNWMQRRLLNRFILSPSPERHSGLGLDAYVTATSPIRKYFDLVTQRQIRGVLGLESKYTSEEINDILQNLQLPMGNVSKLQYTRNRYWILKYLETMIGQKEEAIVLGKRRNGYQVLMNNYMVECDVPVPNGITLKPEDLIQITIQNVNARKDVLSVFMG